MTCRYPESLIEDYTDGELSPAVAAEIEEHLKGCALCRYDYRSTQLLKELLSKTAPPVPGSHYFEEVQALILARTTESVPYAVHKADTDRQSVERVSFYRSLLAVAASLLLFFSALYVGSMQPDSIAGENRFDKQLSGLSSAGAVTKPGIGTELSPFGQDRIRGGLLLVGPPGMLGRLTAVGMFLDSE